MTLESTTGYWAIASEKHLSRNLKISFASPLAKRFDFNLPGINYQLGVITEQLNLEHPLSLTIADSQGLAQLDPFHSDPKIRQIQGYLDYCTSPKPDSSQLAGNFVSRTLTALFSNISEEHFYFQRQGYQSWPTAQHQLVLGCSLEQLHRIAWNTKQPMSFLLQKMIADSLAGAQGKLGIRPFAQIPNRIGFEVHKLMNNPDLLVQSIND